MARFFLTEIVVTLEFVHSKNVLYRDLKLENILLTDTFHTKLCDFNTSQRLAGPTDSVGSIAGTPEYVPPELITEQKTGLSCVSSLKSRQFLADAHVRFSAAMFGLSDALCSNFYLEFLHSVRRVSFSHSSKSETAIFTGRTIFLPTLAI